MLFLPLCPFVSSSLFFTFTLPPYLLFLMAEWRQGKKERVSETDREEKRDEEDGDEEGEKEREKGGKRAPVSRQGFNEEALKFAVIEQRPCPLQKGPTSL